MSHTAAKSSADLARRIRAHALRMVHNARSPHVGSILSAADILAVLYHDVLELRTVSAQDRDRFLLSKGHAAAGLYAVLAEGGFLPVESLDRFCVNGSSLSGHSLSVGNPGVELSSGSLGMGLSVGSGLALGARLSGHSSRVYVLLSDGECNEGSIWEAAIFGAHRKLSNLFAIVDCNQLQSMGRTEDILNLEPFAPKWVAFGWNVIETDGHDHEALKRALSSTDAMSPTCVLCRTTKGKGVSFMENQLEWHYRYPNSEQLELALSELEERP